MTDRCTLIWIVCGLLVYLLQPEMRTPLMIACLRQKTKFAIKLVKKRADILAMDRVSVARYTCIMNSAVYVHTYIYMYIVHCSLDSAACITL